MDYKISVPSELSLDEPRQSRFLSCGGVFRNDTAFGGFVYRFIGAPKRRLCFIFLPRGNELLYLFHLIAQCALAAHIEHPLAAGGTERFFC